MSLESSRSIVLVFERGLDINPTIARKINYDLFDSAYYDKMYYVEAPITDLPNADVLTLILAPGEASGFVNNEIVHTVNNLPIVRNPGEAVDVYYVFDSADTLPSLNAPLSGKSKHWSFLAGVISIDYTDQQIVYSTCSGKTSATLNKSSVRISVRVPTAYKLLSVKDYGFSRSSTFKEVEIVDDITMMEESLKLIKASTGLDEIQFRCIPVKDLPPSDDSSYQEENPIDTQEKRDR